MREDLPGKQGAKAQEKAQRRPVPSVRSVALPASPSSSEPPLFFLSFSLSLFLTIELNVKNRKKINRHYQKVQEGNPGTVRSELSRHAVAGWLGTALVGSETHARPRYRIKRWLRR